MPLILTSTFDRLPRPVLSVDLSGILPDRLAAASKESITRLPITADGRPANLGDLFEVIGDASDGTLECVGDFTRVHGVGAGMAWGTVIVRGNVGRHCGERMIGGRIDVLGDAGDWLAAEMQGGEVRVRGSVGDNAAGALPGSTNGMCGGLVTVGGNAGHLAGARMRRGMLAVAGDSGEGAGFELRAGTVVVAGALGRHAGVGMRRGSILALSGAAPLGCGFRRGATWRPPVLEMLLRRLSRAEFAPAVKRGTTAAPWLQWHGDSLAGGRGELFVPAG